MGAWEAVTNDLARRCGLDVPQAELRTFAKNGGTFLSKRFDRNGAKRIHFASAMTMPLRGLHPHLGAGVCGPGGHRTW